MPEAPDRPTPTKKTCLPRSVSFLGFLLLAVAAFLPQVKGCNTPIIPVHEVFEKNGGLFSQIAWEALFLPFLVAFPLIIIYILHSLIRRPHGRAVLTSIACSLLALAIGYGCFFAARNNLSAPLNFWQVLATMLAAGAVIALLAALRPGKPRSFPRCLVAVGICSLTYFLFWPCEAGIKGIYYGLWVSVAGSVLIAIGGVWEYIQARRIERSEEWPTPLPVTNDFLADRNQPKESDKRQEM